MATEQSRKDQIAALQSWAIKAQMLVDEDKFKEAIHILEGDFGRQAKKVDWELSRLPQTEELRGLQKNIESARAAGRAASNSINKRSAELEYAKKSGKKSPQIAAIIAKSAYLREARKNLSIVIGMLTRARAIVSPPKSPFPKEPRKMR